MIGELLTNSQTHNVLKIAFIENVKTAGGPQQFMLVTPLLA